MHQDKDENAGYLALASDIIEQVHTDYHSKPEALAAKTHQQQSFRTSEIMAKQDAIKDVEQLRGGFKIWCNILRVSPKRIAGYIMGAVVLLFCVQVQAQGNFTRDALITSIVLGYTFDSLQDGITFTKAPQGRDLRHLWHSAKYAHIVMVMATGALNVISIQKYGWKKTLLFDAVGFAVGVLVWRYTYPMWRKVDWGDWA